MEKEEIKDTFGLYLLDFSKIVFVGVVLGNLFTEIPNKIFYVSIGVTVSFSLFIFGFLFLIITRKRG